MGGADFTAQSTGVQTEAGTEFPRLVALAPSVDFFFKNRDQVHPAFLRSVAAAALLANRIPVFPLVPCDSPWIAHRTEEQVGQHRMEASNMIDRFVVPFGPQTNMQCLWKAWACKKCHKVGMPWYEFERVLQELPKPSRKPSEGMLSACSPNLLEALPRSHPRILSFLSR